MTETFFFFFFPERNWGSAFLALPLASEQSVLCAPGVNGRSVRRSGPVCPAEGDRPTLPAHSETRTGPGLRPRPLS